LTARRDETTRVAVASRSFSAHPLLREAVLARYLNVTFNDAGKSLAGDELVAFLDGHDRAITALERLDEDVLVRLPQLNVISKYGVGLDMIDLEAMRRLGKRLGWTPGVNRRSVAELTLSMMIALLHRLPEGDALVKSGGWRQLRGRELSGRTVGIVGCGHVGKEMVRLLGPFGCSVLAHDSLDFADFYRERGVESCDLETLLRRSDLITLHLPLDHTTQNILSEDRFAVLRPDVVLINCARGGLVDEAALFRFLASHPGASAGFDVFAEEPPSGSPLMKLPNFLCSPHIGGSSEEAVLAMGLAAIEGLETAAAPLSTS
jgi:D-3-phosphoglycerate dehydrogenase